MKNVLMQDFSIRENCNIIVRGSYPDIAKQLAKQLLIALEAAEHRVYLTAFGVGNLGVVVGFCICWFIFVR